MLLLFIQCSATEGLLAPSREKLFHHIQFPLQGEVLGAGALQAPRPYHGPGQMLSALTPQLSHLRRL